MFESYQDKIEIESQPPIEYKASWYLTAAVAGAAVMFLSYLGVIIWWTLEQPTVKFTLWQPGTFGDAFGVLTCVFTFIALVGVYQTLKLDMRRAEEAERASRNAEIAARQAERRSDKRAKAAYDQAEKAIREANKRATEAAREAARQARRRESEAEDRRVTERFWNAFEHLAQAIRGFGSPKEYQQWAEWTLVQPTKDFDRILYNDYPNLHSAISLAGSWYGYWRNTAVVKEDLKLASLLIAASCDSRVFRVALRGRLVANDPDIRMAGRMAWQYFEFPDLTKEEENAIQGILAEVSAEIELKTTPATSPPPSPRPS